MIHLSKPFSIVPSPLKHYTCCVYVYEYVYVRLSLCMYVCVRVRACDQTMALELARRVDDDTVKCEIVKWAAHFVRTPSAFCMH